MYIYIFFELVVLSHIHPLEFHCHCGLVKAGLLTRGKMLVGQLCLTVL
jgi:hypothetical protein